MLQNEIEILDHTGDVGIIVRGKSLGSIFERTAQGMFAIICPDNEIRIVREHKFDVVGNNLEELLVNWLAELNYYFSVEYILFSEFQIDKVEENRLLAKARGEKINSNRHHIHTEIKAVTYHKLYVRKIDDGWEAQVIFDI